MRLLKLTLLATCVLGLNTSCFEDQDDNAISTSEINDFVWKAMNAVYLYKDNIPDLANDRFASNEDYRNYLNSFSTPEALFESVIYNRQTIDRFSVIVDDYIALEQQFSGVTKSNGMDFGLYRFTEADTDVFGVVRYVLPNTDAENKGIERGFVFNEVNGTPLTTSNWRSLLSPDSYTINLVDYNDNGTPESIADDFLTPTNTSISLTKSAYTENPIYTYDVLNIDGNNVGYLMYNSFTGTNQFDAQLNSVFGEFKAAGITDLILDLRYNGGGSVNTAIWLASMITGQFTGELFVREQWNDAIQAELEANNPDALLNLFTDEMVKRNTNNEITFQQSINHVNLNRLYVITTGSTASASELIINGLDPYINVVKIGTTTIGKYQASTTLYDSPNFGRNNANPRHTYAVQPLIYKSINSVGFTDFDNGFSPDVTVGEQFNNMGELGNPTEPLLAAAILHLQGEGRFADSSEFAPMVSDSKDLLPFSKEMISDDVINFNRNPLQIP